MTKNRLTELAGIVADPKTASEKDMIKEGLTGPMSITKNDLMNIIRTMKIYNSDLGDVGDDVHVIAFRLLSMLNQPKRSEEADRILSFLLK